MAQGATLGKQESGTRRRSSSKPGTKAPRPWSHGPLAGLFPPTSSLFDCVPESWMSFLAVDDVDARVAMAVKAEAELVMPIFDVPGVSRIAMLREPSGAGIGRITPVGPQTAEGDAK